MRHVVLGILGFSALFLLTEAGPAPSAGQGSSDARILLNIETLLVGPGGFTPLGDAVNEPVPVFSTWGEYHNRVFLEEEGYTIYYVLFHRISDKGRIQLRLESRNLRPRGHKVEVLSAVEHEITAMEAWNTTLHGSGRGVSIDLRVVPVLRRAVADETFDSARFWMRLRGGPLIRYGRNAREDRVIFREMNGGGRGLEMGIPELGVVRLALKEFPGSKKCGWVRGHDLLFVLGEQEFKVWSTIPILPEDPDRPGKGWILYGSLEPNSSLPDKDAYYGAWTAGP